ncbi:DUF6090 family protein [Christiangramia crocea]|uniref:DUF6090 family protein n=1 Tax=Christiangramia crocea TaxID=2904124 RepID=A0A9X1V2F1_9FLAO|nr:DUF6090 family protein [Gramella crocea]MCG9973378.1 DUF6090 family protein [Gramella crocea]
MIKFFRHIRRRLLRENRFTRYLIYAIGEIILVVIGILIALQINNWNETRQNEAKVRKLLRKIQNDIEDDVAIIQDNIPYYARKDSIGYMVLNDLLSPEEYQNPEFDELHYLALELIPMNMKSVGYDNLRAAQFIIPEDYDTIVENLIYQYEDLLKVLQRTHEFLLEDVRSNKDYLYKTYDWYSSTQPNYLNEDRIDYLLNNIRYKGMVRKYLDASTNEYIRRATSYLETALENYEDINQVLGEKNKMSLMYDASALEERFLGEYKIVSGDTIDVYSDGGRFYLQGERLHPLFPYAKDKFFLGIII